MILRYETRVLLQNLIQITLQRVNLTSFLILISHQLLAHDLHQLLVLFRVEVAEYQLLQSIPIIESGVLLIVILTRGGFSTSSSFQSLERHNKACTHVLGLFEFRQELLDEYFWGTHPTLERFIEIQLTCVVVVDHKLNQLLGQID